MYNIYGLESEYACAINMNFDLEHVESPVVGSIGGYMYAWFDMATEDGVSGAISTGRGKSQHEAMAAVIARILATPGSTAPTVPSCRREMRAEEVGREKPKSQRKKRKLKVSGVQSF